MKCKLSLLRARVPDHSHSLSLAPAAGAGIGKLVADRLLADPEFIPAMVAAALGGLRASRSWWNKVDSKTETDPDYRVQVQTFGLLLAHMEGEPIKRVIHEHLSAAGVDLVQELRANPQLREAVDRTLRNADDYRPSGAELRRRKALRKVGPATEVDVD